MQDTDAPHERLRQHLRNAYAKVPFYRHLWDAAGVDPTAVTSVRDLAALPMITKEQIIQDQRDHPPFGSCEFDRHDLARVNLIASTYYICLTHDDQRALTQMFGEIFALMGVRDTDLVDVASAFHWVSGGTQMDAALRSIGAAVIPGGPGQSEQRLRVLKETGATVLQAFTPYAEELGQRFEAAGIDVHRDLKVRLLIIGGELRDSRAKQRLQQAWGGAAIREYYGVSEAGIVAAECFEAGDGMHIVPQCIVEVIDPETGAPVEPGMPGEIVTTELVRSSQPFIRYRTGDITEGIRYEPCACGRHTPRLGRILGRRASIPRIRGLFVAPALVERAVREFPAAGAWRLVITRPGTTDTVRLQVELPSGSEIADTLGRNLKAAVGISIQIEPAEPGSIDPNAPQVDDQRVYR